MKAAAALAHRLAGLRLSETSPRARAKARLHILDTLGVMYAGHSGAESAAVLEVVAPTALAGQSTVVGRAGGAPAADAAFCNAFLGRVHTFDDTFEDGPVHPGSAVVAAALAVAESSGADGARLLAAVLAGYETAVRVSRAAGTEHYASGFHSTGTINAFAAAAAAARAMDLDADTFTHALGHAGGGASGLRQYQVDGALSDSALNGARASAWGVRCAELAAAGVAGPAGILDGPWGFLKVMSATPDVELVDAAGAPGESITAVSLKPYPSCRFTHGPAHVLKALRAESRIDPAHVERVYIDTFRQSVDVSDKPSIRTRSDAILSHQFAAACMLLTGEITLDAFDPTRINDARTRDLAARVQVRHDPDLDPAYPSAWPHRVTVLLRGGKTLRGLSEHPPGTPEQPLADAEVATKFTTLCTPVLGEQGTRVLGNAVSALECATAGEVRALGMLLRAV